MYGNILVQLQAHKHQIVMIYNFLYTYGACTYETKLHKGKLKTVYCAFYIIHPKTLRQLTKTTFLFWISQKLHLR
jgi:hypothetical protein